MAGPVRSTEETFNSLSHGLGALLSAVGLPLLLMQAAKSGNPLHMVACAVFGATMFATLGASALYHGTAHPERKKNLRILDHATIFTLIAGGYTPFCLMSIPGALGMSLLGIVWTCAVFGVLLKVFHTGRYERLSLMMYLGMGWMSLVAIGPMWENMLAAPLALLIIAGLLFTLGVVFYYNDHRRGFHLIWHMLVLCGCACLYGAVLLEIPVPA
ncbi:MAG: hemolysin III family protein [bacterium]